MAKITTNKKNSIINFSKTFISCYNKAEEYYRKGAYDDALQEANNAYSIEYNADVLLLLAEIYMEKECYDLVMLCSCQVLALGNLDKEKRERLFLLIPRALIELGHNFASVFYVLRNSPEISEALSKIVPQNQTLDGMLEKEIKSLLESQDEEEKSKLVLSERKREEYNEETLNRAVNLISDGELTDAKHLLLSLYETDTKDYREGRRFLAYVYATEGDTDKAVDILYGEFQKDKTYSDWIDSVQGMGEKYSEQTRKMLEEFLPSERKSSMYEAISIACRCGYDDLAYKYAEMLSSTYPDDIKCGMLRILAKWNCESTSETKRELIQLLYTAKVYYPVKFIERLRFPDRFDLRFNDFPFELIPKLNRNVLKAVQSYNDGDDYSELLSAVMFLMRNVCQDNYTLVDHMIDEIQNIGGQFLLDLYKRITTMPKIHPEIQKYAIEELVDRYRKGKFFYNNEGFIMEITLRVPPSYEDFSIRLKDEYCRAFSLISEFDNRFQKHLCEIFEKIYLKDIIGEFPRNSKFSMIVVYYYIMKKTPEALTDFCRSMNINKEKYKEYALKLKSLLQEDE